MAAFARNCDQCGTEYEAKRATSRFCTAACRAAHRRNPPKVEIVTGVIVPGTAPGDNAGSRDEQVHTGQVIGGHVASQLAAALSAAKDRITTEDAAAVAVLELLAVKMDNLSVIDTDTPAMFLRYCTALGLTPASRRGLSAAKGAKQGGKLASVSNIPRPA